MADEYIGNNDTPVIEDEGMPYEMLPENEPFSQVFIALCAVRGKYRYDRALGSTLGTIDRDAPDALVCAEAAAREALKRIPAAEVMNVEMEDGLFIITVRIGSEESVMIL